MTGVIGVSSQGQQSKIVDPTGAITTFVYDSNPHIRRIVDAAGRSTTYAVDGSGNLTQKTTPELCITQYRYDASHRMTVQIDPSGARTSYGYDSMNRLVKQTFPNGGRTTTTYNDWTHTTITDPGGHRTSMQFGVGRVEEDPEPPLVGLDDESKFVHFIFEEFLKAAGDGFDGHVLTIGHALLELHRMGHKELARKGVPAYWEWCRGSRDENRGEAPPPTPQAPTPLNREY